MKAFDWDELSDSSNEAEFHPESMEDNRFDVDDWASVSGADRLDTAERRELPDSDYGLPAERKFPMPDAAHVRAAEAYFRYAPDDKKGELARNILAQAQRFGVDVKSPTILEWADR